MDLKRISCGAGLATLSLTLFVGCGGTTNSSTASKSSGSSATSGTENSVSSVQVVPGQGTEPGQCVAIFLDSLRSGDEESANGVLTAKAREELAKTPYEMQPLGTPEGAFEVGRVGYPYEEKDIALVECQWTEPSAPGEPPLTMDIVCEVRKETEGWRIAGLVVTSPGSEETLVLDFENANSLQATIDGATGNAATGTSSAQATIPAQTVSGSNALPQGSVPASLPPANLPPSELPPSNYPALPSSSATPQQQTPASTNGGLPPLPAYPQ